MAKAKATKGDSKGAPIILEEDVRSELAYERHMSVKLPDLEMEVAEAVCADVLRGLYVNHLKFYYEQRDVKTAKDGKVFTKEELEQHEKVLNNLEGTICYLDQTDQWLRDLHDGKFAEEPKDK